MCDFYEHTYNFCAYSYFQERYQAAFFVDGNLLSEKGFLLCEQQESPLFSYYQSPSRTFISSRSTDYEIQRDCS